MIPTKTSLSVEPTPADLENEEIVSAWLYPTQEENYRNLEHRAIDTLPLPLRINDIERVLEENHLTTLDYIVIHPAEVIENLPEAQWWSHDNPERYLPQPGDLRIDGNSGMMMVDGRPLLLYITELCPPNLFLMLSREDIQVFELHS